MKYIYTPLLLIFALINCNTEETNQETMKEKVINITGTAYNGKGGALIITENNETYYIGGLDSWEDSVLEKEVEVNGFIRTEIFSEDDLKDETGAWKQGMIGEKLTILKAQWNVIE